jgi:hypothetical protein
MTISLNIITLLQINKLNTCIIFKIIFQALLHPYFFNEPLQCLEHLMPKPPKDHRQKLMQKPIEVIESLEKNFSCLYKILDETV